jgi:hypothetical protein
VAPAFSQPTSYVCLRPDALHTAQQSLLKAFYPSWDIYMHSPLLGVSIRQRLTRWACMAVGLLLLAMA